MPKIDLDRLTWVASHKRISNVVLNARADRIVVNNSALCVFTAHSDARINTLVSDASLFVWAVFVVGTLWSAAIVGITKVFWITSANAPGSRNTWARVRSTRVWLARVQFFCWLSCACNRNLKVNFFNLLEHLHYERL